MSCVAANGRRPLVLIGDSHLARFNVGRIAELERRIQQPRRFARTDVRRLPIRLRPVKDPLRTPALRLRLIDFGPEAVD